MSMTNQEFAVEKLKESISCLTDIVTLMENGGIPQNEDWVKCALPLNSVMNIMMNYSSVKDENYVEDKF